MGKNATLQRIIDGLMKTELVKDWALFNEKTGTTLLKIRFLPSSDNMDTHDDSSVDRNTDIHMYRKSDKRLKRDLCRAKSHRDRMANNAISGSDGVSDHVDGSESDSDVSQQTCDDDESVDGRDEAVDMVEPAAVIEDPDSESSGACAAIGDDRSKLTQSFSRWPTSARWTLNKSMPSLKCVDGHVYTCENCKESWSDPDPDSYDPHYAQTMVTVDLGIIKFRRTISNLAYCCKCSRGGEDKYICDKCFHGSDHCVKKCLLSVIDFT